MGVGQAVGAGSTKVPESQIETEMSNIREETERLSAEWTAIGGRLSIVITPIPPTEEPGKPEEALCALAEELRNHRNRLQEIRVQIAQTTECLQL